MQTEERVRALADFSLCYGDGVISNYISGRTYRITNANREVLLAAVVDGKAERIVNSSADVVPIKSKAMNAQCSGCVGTAVVQ